MSNQDKPRSPASEQKSNPRTTDVKQGSREPLPVEKNPTQSTSRGNTRPQRDDSSK